MPKISELTSATTIAGTETIPLVQSSTTKKVTADTLMGYKVFIANLTYNTTINDFQNSVMKDTIGDISFARVSAGKYTIDSSGSQFTNGKTFLIVNQNYNGDGIRDTDINLVFASQQSIQKIRVQTMNFDITTGTATIDDLLTNCTIEIRIYP
jgi:hypothetical protein